MRSSTSVPHVQDRGGSTRETGRRNCMGRVRTENFGGSNTGNCEVSSEMAEEKENMEVSTRVQKGSE